MQSQPPRRGADVHLRYEEWADLLGTHFFNPDMAGKPVHFCPDDVALAEVVGLSSELAIKSLVESVRSRISPTHHSNIFQRAMQEGTRWKLDGGVGYPPFLPLLGLSVLAAIRMAHTDGVASHNYYLRFNELLGLSGRGMPKGYDATFPYLWSLYGWWLNDVNQGALGISTVREDASRPNQGYSISQALLRRSDRQRLTFFFQWLGLDAAEPVDARELLPRFKAWASGRQGLSAGLQYMLAHDEFDDRLAEALEGEAARWDGVLRDEHGRKVGRIHLTLVLFPRLQIGAVAARPPGFPERQTYSTNAGGGGTIELVSSEEGWYDTPLPPTLVETVLQEGLRLTSSEYILSVKPDVVIPFRANFDLGCWSSVRQIRPKETHWVLVHRQHARQVTAFLQQFGAEGWRQQNLGPPLGDAWTLLRDVVLDEVPERIPSESLRRLIPAPTNRVSMQGGLEIERRYYLSGGEPDIWIPAAGSEDAPMTIVIDEQKEEAAPETYVRLSSRGLAAGAHEIAVDGAEFRFRTMYTTGVREPAQSRSLIHVIAESAGHRGRTLGVRPYCEDDEQNTCVAGSLIFGSSVDTAYEMRPLVLPVGPRQLFLLGAVPGQVERPEQVPVPAWLRHQQLESNRFEWHPSFAVAWVIEKWSPGGWRFRLRHELDPAAAAPEGVTEQDLEDWCELLQLEGPCGEREAAAWGRFRTVAEGLQ